MVGSFFEKAAKLAGFLLTGLSTATQTTILTGDNALVAFGKLQGQLNKLFARATYKTLFIPAGMTYTPRMILAGNTSETRLKITCIDATTGALAAPSPAFTCTIHVGGNTFTSASISTSNPAEVDVGPLAGAQDDQIYATISVATNVGVNVSYREVVS